MSANSLARQNFDYLSNNRCNGQQETVCKADKSNRVIEPDSAYMYEILAHAKK